ncbi:MAG: SIMPL domain-containing protein [Rhodopirellula sp.]|nr:SIMPL domain-containing protein [Rhodopirellula sp.]
MGDTDRHIEVVSSANVSRTVESYRARIDLTVATRKKQSCLDESITLRDDVLSALSDAGISADNVEEGGGQVTQSSWSSTKTVTHQLQVSHTDMSVIIQAMANVERIFASIKLPWFSGIRKDFTFNAPTPDFMDDPNAAENAFIVAIANAKRKAAILAQEAGLQLGHVISITEESRAKSQQQINHQFGATDDLFHDDFNQSFAESLPFSYSPAAPRQGTARSFFRVRFAITDGP